MYKIKYIRTGHIFELPDNEAVGLKEKFPNEYQILEKNGKKYRDKTKQINKEINLKNIRELVLDTE